MANFVNELTSVFIIDNDALDSLLVGGGATNVLSLTIYENATLNYIEPLSNLVVLSHFNLSYNDSLSYLTSFPSLKIFDKE